MRGGTTRVIGKWMSTRPNEADTKPGIIDVENVIEAKRSSEISLRVRDEMMAIDGLILRTTLKDRQRHMLHGTCLQTRHLLILHLEQHHHMVPTKICILERPHLQSFTYRLLHLLMSPRGHQHQRALDLLRILWYHQDTHLV
jgi:hypothetical protein